MNSATPNMKRFFHGTILAENIVARYLKTALITAMVLYRYGLKLLFLALSEFPPQQGNRGALKS